MEPVKDDKTNKEVKQGEKIALSLTSNEKKVLKSLKTGKSEWTSTDLQEKTGLKQVEIARALQWLDNKDLLSYDISKVKSLRLASLGKQYVKNGFPEEIFLKEVQSNPKTKKELQIKLSDQEINVCIGLLKRNSWIEIEKNKSLTFKITEAGKKKVKKGFEVRKHLEDLPKHENSFTKDVLKDLKSRKDLVETKDITTYIITLSKIGSKVKEQKSLLDKKTFDDLTSEDLQTGAWKNKTYRYYDVQSPVPTPDVGRKHFVNEAIKYVKQIYTSLGFEEISGNHVQSSFWNLDALFVPQDHPAREMQDTFYFNHESTLPKQIKKKVKNMHVGDEDAAGWSKEYSEEIAKKTLLRTHTTVLSAKKFSEMDLEDLPKKIFTVGKNYRNEALDWKHLFEFHQIDGIVIDEDGTLAKLKGHLKDFMQKIGYPDVRIRPAYFPYTEPSCEVDVFHPVKKEWVEIGGAGIIRPEITKALLGKEIPVLAWGLGLERMISNYFNITDIRKIYENDLDQIKKSKIFFKKQEEFKR